VSNTLQQGRAAVRAAILSLLVAAPVFGADIYRTVAPDGTVSYSDVPQGPTATPVTVVTSRPRSSTPSAAAPSAAAQQRTPAEATSGEKPKEWYPKAEKRTAQEEAADNAKKCADARAKAERLAQSRRIYRKGPDGEPQYLDSTGIDEARARAASEAEQACKGSSG
jgi:hypothetical protein